ncbi:undecaprenyl-phosphate glucose phosphotransferase [Uliginosibacterium aquaticum]|uniref:Undecaprenyl-phosphate glucose phosphotransferase n=1 Tax=Uliginosibacterium aquaticum TaxID=2731212 RepID=A0ABX2IJ01_9RHOO|nr:undecaprenyl-phosphate glucose phosphotransferase [Uliginosibacterium aquaticum]NSL54025.1 undecaprenyl-phosphate glucose phosphotransferase [Uliginosibacterium aquaticum]
MRTAASFSWLGQEDSLRSRYPLVGIVETLLGPCIAVLSLAASVAWFGQSFDRHYLALSLMTFLLLFPGILRISEDRWRMAGKAALAWLTLCFTLLVFGHTTGYLHYYHQGVIAVWQVGTLLALLLAHEAARQMLKRVLASNQRSAVIIGGNDTGVELARHFETDRYAGIRFRGFFDDRPRERMSPRSSDLPLLGTVSELGQFVKAQGIDQIYIALPMASQPRILALLDQLKDTTASIYFAPDLFVTDLIQGRVEQIGGMPVVAVCDTPFRGMNGVIKRLEDVILSSIILVLISPVLLACAIAVKLSSPGPVIFKQRRYGLDGKEVLVYKFRSMTATDNGPVVKQATKNDARITRVGAFLRKTSLDELPQFINALQGRMSIVGPRPHAVAHNEQYRKLIKGYMVRHKVRPGITGWAQVNGARGETDTLEKMERRIVLDLHYLRHWSLALDLKIILRTVGLMAKDETAY